MLSYNFPFDAVQMPLNCFDATFKSFEKQVLPELIRRGIAPIGFKSSMKFDADEGRIQHGFPPQAEVAT